MADSSFERILYVMPGLNVCGGMESYAMNYLRHIDRSRYVIDFVTHDVGDENYVAEIESLGGEVTVLPPFSLGSLGEIRSAIGALLGTGAYKIIHCHMANAAYFYFKEAKAQGIPVRILHSHQSRAADSFFHAVRNLPLLWLGKRYATHFVACSKAAGDFLFKKEPYTILRNAIEPEYFMPDEGDRLRTREALGITGDTLLVGHIGRFCPQKNQEFLLEIFSSVLTFHPDACLIMIGEGADAGLLKERAGELGIADRVIFHDTTRETPSFYRAMDVFCMPSVYEGLSVVAVEAQAAGLPCLFSDRMSPETDLGGRVEFMPLSAPATEWAKRIVTLGHLGAPGDTADIIREAGYDISSEAGLLLDYYDAVVALTQKAHA